MCMKRPLEKITELETGQEVTITDEHGNTYTGTFEWDSSDELHMIDGLRLVAEYDADELYLVKPVETGPINGFLTKVQSIETV